MVQPGLERRFRFAKKMFWLGLIGGGFLLMPIALVLIGGLTSILAVAVSGGYRVILGVVALLWPTYWVVALIGTWNAATKHEGDAAPRNFAKLAVVIIGIYVLSQLPDRMEMITGFLTSR